MGIRDKKKKNDLFAVHITTSTRELITSLTNCIASDPIPDRKKKLETLIAPLNTAPVRLLLAVTGEYDVGKSSLINALTGSNLLVDADVTTVISTEIDYGDAITLVDMPGFLSGNDHHEAIAKKTIIDSDLILFVVTNELFNASSLPSFKNLIEEYNKQDQILLVVNQIDRVNLRDRTMDQVISVMTEALREQVHPFPIENSGPLFISARDFLDSHVISDPVKAHELQLESRLNTLVIELDRFCKLRGPKGRLARPIQQVLGATEEVRKIILQGKPEEQIIHEYISRKLTILTNARSDWSTTSSNLAEESSHEVLQLAEPVLRAIEKRADADEINSLWTEANDKVASVKARYEDKMRQIAEDAITMLNGRLLELHDSPVGIEVEKFINLEELSVNPNSKLKDDYSPLSKNSKLAFKNGFQATGKYLTKNTVQAGEVAVNIAKFFGAKFKPYGSQKLAGNVGQVVGKAGKALGPLAVGLEIYLNYREDTAKEKVNESRRQFKAEVRNTFSAYAKTLEDSVRESARNFAQFVYDAPLGETQAQRTQLSHASMNNEKMLSKLATIESDARKLLASFDEVNSSSQS